MDAPFLDSFDPVFSDPRDSRHFQNLLHAKPAPGKGLARIGLSKCPFCCWQVGRGGTPKGVGYFLNKNFELWPPQLRTVHGFNRSYAVLPFWKNTLPRIKALVKLVFYFKTMADAARGIRTPNPLITNDVPDDVRPTFCAAIALENVCGSSLPLAASMMLRAL
jgi:hypothetical protein